MTDHQEAYEKPHTDLRKLREAEMATSLRKAGVGRIYCGNTYSLQSVLNGKQLADRLKGGEIDDLVGVGGVITLQGDGEWDLTLAHLFCRGCILSRIPAKIVSLYSYCEGTVRERGSELSAELLEKDVLILTEFYSPDHGEAFTPAELYGMESYLRQWLMDGKALVLQYPDPCKVGVAKWWWSDSFTTFVTSKTVLNLQ